jgi:large subunit ribosomal protein L10
MADVNTSKNRQNKEAIVAQLVEKVEKSKGIIFANYQGLTHQQLESLKKNLKKAESEFFASKNTLLMRALKDKFDTEAYKEHFTKPTGALFIYNDVIEPLKLLSKSIKDLKLPEIKFGFLDGKVVSDKDVVRIATLPPLPVLRAQLLGQMNAPIQGLHRALSWNMQSLVMTLNAIKEKKS